LKTEATLPDWIGPGLNILSVGLNPSLNSLRAGFPGRICATGMGLQPQRIGVSQVYITPDPSSANATYSLDALILCYRKLAELNRSRQGG